jgi:hypothetical protein
MHLYEEFNKLHPEQATLKKEPDPETMTFEDMKKYFDGMKESLMNEFKEQISALKTSEKLEDAPEDKPKETPKDTPKEEKEENE